MKKQRVKEEAETEGRPSLPPGDPRAEKSARMQTFTPSRSPSLPLPHSTHSRSHFNNHNTVGRTDGQGEEEEEAIWSVDRPSVSPPVFPLPMSPYLRPQRPFARRRSVGRRGASLVAPRRRGRGDCRRRRRRRRRRRQRVPSSKGSARTAKWEGRKEGNLARLHSLLMHSQSVTKLQGIEEQQ